MKYYPQYTKELERLLRRLAKDKKLFHEFLIDLFSPAELKEMGLRLQIIKLLNKKHSHRDIAKQLKTSLATITRGSREMQNHNGGFALVLKKYYSKNARKF